MATLLKADVRNKRKDGFYPVYIRVTHNRNIAYIRTDKMVAQKDLSSTNEIQDPYVLQYCTRVILEYNDKLNRMDTRHWSVRQVVDYLTSDAEDISFSAYARRHIGKMIDKGQERTAVNYRGALQSLELFMGTNNVLFSSLTSQTINRWIEVGLGNTKRAKEMYPICMRQVFKAALLEYNDYDNDFIRIRNNPWMKVEIPSSDRPEKLAITPEECRKFFSFPIPESRMRYPKAEFGRDVVMMVLCLGGINTIDLYQLRKQDYSNGIIRYQRAKTKKFRADGAYMEMKVPAILTSIFEKYRNTDTNDEHLFNFYQRMTTPDSFNANVNSGLKEICNLMGIPKEEQYSVYTFRHTWGTVAQNDVRASISDVAFAMNHSSGHKITRGYIKIDFSPAWELNEKVIDFIFFSDQTSVREQQKQEEAHFRLSYRFMVDAAAYYNGKTLAKFTDVGFNNVDEVIDKLVSMLPDDIPDRAIVLFKIVNVDKKQTVVYQRQKGKGF